MYEQFQLKKEPAAQATGFFWSRNFGIKVAQSSPCSEVFELDDWAWHLTDGARIGVGWRNEYENESAPLHLLRAGCVERPE